LSLTRDKGKLALIRQDRGFPLRNFKRAIRIREGAAGEPPSLFDLTLAQDSEFFRTRAQAMVQDLDTASTAAAFTTARKLNSEAEENIFQWRSTLHFNGLPERLQRQADAV
jgi:hypothetical protein